ncbi:sigma-70 family RNA polymerase sigma factor [Inediibacterium massiliense]|uniref:sigma-70 family RNA polymerase sigma factor n=1 Tax=Inediibacterium massiliense TaxID=1658111 RepID=UPI0006B69E29|nr:sigma-70 family RNA polymerase sigma factor [Inediibacterium massiliense]
MKITEENFILQLKNQNEKALEYVIDHYGGLIQSIVKKHLYNLQSYQEECVNDILLGIWNNIYSFNESKSTFKNWVGAISKYKTIDFRRKYLKDLKNQNIDYVEISIEDSTLKAITKEELNKDLEELLNCLKDEDKKLFLKLYVKEQEVNEISKETGLKKDVIYNRISRGKKKLKRMFHIIESRR